MYVLLLRVTPAAFVTSTSSKREENVDGLLKLTAWAPVPSKNNFVPVEMKA